MNQNGAEKPPGNALDGRVSALAANNTIPHAVNKPTSDVSSVTNPTTSYLSPSINWSDGIEQWGLND